MRKRILLIIICIILIVCAASCGSDKEYGAEINAPTGILNGGIYKIKNMATGRYLNMQMAGMLDNAMTVQLAESNMLDELWRAIEQDSGTWQFENVMTGRYLSIRDKKAVEGTITEVKLTDEETWLWNIEAHSGAYGLIPGSAGSGLRLGLINDDIAFTNKPVITAISEPELSLWEFEKVDLQEELPVMLPVEGKVFHSSCPQIIKSGDVYYMYIMAPGISIKASYDMIEWFDVGKVFGGGDPSWLTNEVPGYGIWAPSVYEIGGKFYVYYCISIIGSQNSAIGVAVNETLDHTAADYKWVDKGMVIRSKTGDLYNCIDPNIAYDEDDSVWLTFGSFWNGLYQVQIDAETGHLLYTDLNENTPIHVAKRIGNNGAIEAPYIVKRGKYYYLFVAFNQMDPSYHNRVGRSENIHGPYVDMDGKEMLAGGGTIVTKGLPELQMPGHASVFIDDDGMYYFVGEYFKGDWKTNTSIMMISTIVWDEEGWPVTALTPDIAVRLNKR